MFSAAALSSLNSAMGDQKTREQTFNDNLLTKAAITPKDVFVNKPLGRDPAAGGAVMILGPDFPLTFSSPSVQNKVSSSQYKTLIGEVIIQAANTAVMPVTFGVFAPTPVNLCPTSSVLVNMNFRNPEPFVLSQTAQLVYTYATSGTQTSAKVPISQARAGFVFSPLGITMPELAAQGYQFFGGSRNLMINDMNGFSFSFRVKGNPSFMVKNNVPQTGGQAPFATEAHLVVYMMHVYGGFDSTSLNVTTRQYQQREVISSCRVPLVPFGVNPTGSGFFFGGVESTNVLFLNHRSWGNGGRYLFTLFDVRVEVTTTFENIFGQGTSQNGQTQFSSSLVLASVDPLAVEVSVIASSGNELQGATSIARLISWNAMQGGVTMHVSGEAQVEGVPSNSNSLLTLLKRGEFIHSSMEDVTNLNALFDDPEETGFKRVYEYQDYAAARQQIESDMGVRGISASGRMGPCVGGQGGVCHGRRERD